MNKSSSPRPSFSSSNDKGKLEIFIIKPGTDMKEIINIWEPEIDGIYEQIISKVVYEYRLLRLKHNFDLTFINVDSNLVRCTCDDDIDEDYAKRGDRRLQLDLVISLTTSVAEVASDTVSSEVVFEVQTQSLTPHRTSAPVETQVDTASVARSLPGAMVASRSYPKLSKSTSISPSATATATATNTASSSASRTQAGDQGMGSVIHGAVSSSSQHTTTATNNTTNTTSLEPASKIRKTECESSNSRKSKSSSNQQLQADIQSVGKPGQMSLTDPVLEQQQVEDVDKGNNTPQDTTKPWHSPSDTPHRKAMSDSIIQLLELKRPNAADWRTQMPQVAGKLEERLYFSANSVDEYVDMSTFSVRLKRAAIQIGAKPPGQASYGDPALEQDEDIGEGEQCRRLPAAGTSS